MASSPYTSGQGALVKAFERFRKTFPPVLDASAFWLFVLLCETIVKDCRKKNARARELLEFARLRRTSPARQEKLL